MTRSFTPRYSIRQQMVRSSRAVVVTIALALGANACSRGAARARGADTLDVYVAASLSDAVGAALDTFAAQHPTVIRRESGASIELARRLTELHRVPDLLILADAELFPRLLVPRYTPWYLGFATDHMVLAYTPRSRYAAQIDSTNWMDVVRRAGVEVGRADPSVAPVGYRTLILFQLAQRHYRRPGLADSLLAAAPDRNVRGNASALAGLLGTGDLDYMYDYQSVAQAKGFQFVKLPDAIDLGDPARASDYALATVRVRGASGDSATVRGAPILSALAIPAGAPHPAVARAFLGLLLGPATRARFAAAHVDLLPSFQFVGADTPAVIRSLNGSRK